MIECANSESTGEMRQFSVRRHLSSASGKGGQWVVHPVDSNAFPYRVQATIKYNVLLNCLRLLFIMGRKGGFSCPGGGQNVAHGTFPCFNNHASFAICALVKAEAETLPTFTSCNVPFFYNISSSCCFSNTKYSLKMGWFSP